MRTVRASYTCHWLLDAVIEDRLPRKSLSLPAVDFWTHTPESYSVRTERLFRFLDGCGFKTVAETLLCLSQNLVLAISSFWGVRVRSFVEYRFQKASKSFSRRLITTERPFLGFDEYTRQSECLDAYKAAV